MAERVPGDPRVNRALGLIRSAIERGDFPAAIAEFTHRAEVFVEAGIDLPLGEFESWLDQLEAYEPDNPWLLFHRAWASSTQRRHTLALSTLRRAEQRFDATLEAGSSEWRRARFLTSVARGVTAERDGQFGPAREAFEEAQRMSETGTQPARSEDEERWLSHDSSGFFAYYLHAIPLYRQTGLTMSLARACHNLGTRLIDRGEPQAARGLLEQARELKTGGGNRLSLANTLNSLGHSERHLGLVARADAHLTGALEIAEEVGHEWLRSYALNNLGELRRDERRFAEAVDLYRRSLEIKERTDNAFGMAHTYASLADCYLATGDPAAALAAAEQAAALRLPTEDPLESARLRSCRARSRIAIGAGGADELASAADELERLDAKADLAVARWWQAVASHRLGDVAGALAAARASLALVDRHGLDHVLAAHGHQHPEILALLDGDAGSEAVRQRLGRLRTPGDASATPAVPADAGRVQLRATLFGELRVWLGDQEVPLSTWRSRRAVSLLALLLHRGGRPIQREEAMEMLWPEGDPERVNRHLNVALSMVRHGLEAVVPAARPIVQRQGASYRIDPSAIGDLDVVRFRELAAQAERHADEGDLPAAVRVADEALVVTDGEYLASERGSWAAIERDQLREAVVDLRLGSAEWHLALGQARQAAGHANAALARERWRERGWRSLILAHQAMGDRAAALQSVHACEQALQEELGVSPSPELMSLARSLEATS